MLRCVLALVSVVGSCADTTFPYQSRGSIDVGTCENTIFFWNKTMYLVENIVCGYADHAGIWFPEFAGHSYARIRELYTGRVLVNITTSIGYGFLSGFPDYDHGKLWLFGTPADRCKGNCGAGPAGKSCATVQAWWSMDAVNWDTALAVDDATLPGHHTYNTEVSRVRSPPASLPAHGYVMISEPFNFLINNDLNGDLTATGAGWTVAPHQAPPKAPSGGPSIKWSNGFYYAITGGETVNLARSKDLYAWEPAVTMISPTIADNQVAPFNGFAKDALRKGFDNMMKNSSAWDLYSNDGDICCTDQAAAAAAGHGSANQSWLVWGASTQGADCGIYAPNHSAAHNDDQVCSTNAIATYDGTADELLASFFNR
jgi:hypothetical protein